MEQNEAYHKIIFRREVTIKQEEVDLEVLVDEYLVEEEHQIYTTYAIILENLCKIFKIPTQHSHIADIYSMWQNISHS